MKRARAPRNTTEAVITITPPSSRTHPHRELTPQVYSVHGPQLAQVNEGSWPPTHRSCICRRSIVQSGTRTHRMLSWFRSRTDDSSSQRLSRNEGIWMHQTVRPTSSLVGIQNRSGNHVPEAYSAQHSHERTPSRASSTGQYVLTGSQVAHG